ncbi:MAG: helix-turn-helix transcriptional regulator [Planctomycetota bacterium]
MSERYQDGRTPPGRVPKAERILNLISVLLRADKPVPVADILGRVTGYDDDATRDSLMRRFERDKKVLRDIGIPIEHANPGAFGQEGYSISRRDYFLDDELQLPPESGQLLRTLFAMAHVDGGDLSADLRSALVKLGFLVDDEDAEEAAPAEATETLEPAAPQVGSNLERLSEAVLLRQRVRFRYHSLYRNEEYDVQVDPYGLGFSGQAWHRGAWYLVGHSHLRGALRVFKVRRIRGEVRLVGKTDAFTPPADFRVRDHVGKARWEWRELAAALAGANAAPERGEPYQALVGFDPAMVTEVRSRAASARPVAATEVPGARPDLSYLAFSVLQPRPLLRFLLRFVPRVHVAHPPELADGLRELAREVLSRYEDDA